MIFDFSIDFVVEVIPSINVKTFEEVKERIAKIEPHVQWCHLDVTDGVFSKHPTWNNPADLARLDTKLNVEVHLMIQNPAEVIDDWLVKPVKRVIIHAEVLTEIMRSRTSRWKLDFNGILKKCRDKEVELGVAINPDTSWELLNPYFDKADILQVLTVSPGPSGQQPDWPAMLVKIKHIRGACRGCIIEVDGGINPDSAKETRDAGAELLVAGHYLFTHQNIEKAIESIRHID